ncbi:hypothetical protein PTKIN_Ptkin12aG0099600 [Pterospermum kingtungense]
MTLGDELPYKEDWDNVRRLCKFLKKFYDLTLKISGTSYVSSKLFLKNICDVYCCLNAWEKDGDNEMAGVAKKMKEEFDKY